MKFFKKRIHESVGFAAMFAVGLTLNVAWILNFLVYRIDAIKEMFILQESVGLISGLYLSTLVSFFVLFGISLLYFKGKDVSHHRDGILWFFIVSVLIFFIMTIPAVYEFSVIVE